MSNMYFYLILSNFFVLDKKLMANFFILIQKEDTLSKFYYPFLKGNKTFIKKNSIKIGALLFILSLSSDILEQTQFYQNFLMYPCNSLFSNPMNFNNIFLFYSFIFCRINYSYDYQRNDFFKISYKKNKKLISLKALILMNYINLYHLQ